MTIFEKPGRENTAETVRIAVQKAAALGAELVVASYGGGSAKATLEEMARQGWNGRLVVVRGVSSEQTGGVNRMSSETKAALEAQGAVVVTTAHALSAGERGLSSSFQGVYPLEIMAHTLRTLGQGVKVCFECAVMALDADAVTFGRPVVALGGTGGGVDTALVITPSYSATILKTKVNEILCKPGFYPEA